MGCSIDLSNKQKQYLFDEYYVDAKVLDALIYKGWQDYFMRFTWKLSLARNCYGFYELSIRDGCREIYHISLNFQGTDLDSLLNIKN